MDFTILGLIPLANGDLIILEAELEKSLLDSIQERLVGGGRGSRSAVDLANFSS